LTVATCSVAIADAPDPIKARLDQARSGRDADVEKARDRLVPRPD